MKKILFFAAAAALLTACSSEELAGVETQQNAEGDAINFSVYTPRTTRAGAPGVMDNMTVGTNGFGILAYYTDNTKYSKETSTPNYMYNTKVTKNGTKWEYNPVMYWPNEYGKNDARSQYIDYVSFFAYAPYTEVEPESGIPYKDPADPSLGLVDDNEKNITEISSNIATGDPIVKYIVDTNPATSVDLLWGVAANETDYTPIISTAGVEVKEALPFVNLIKPKNPATDKLNFKLLHALSKLNVNVRYVADEKTNVDPLGSNKLGDSTRIYIRSIKIGGFVVKGALNLNSTKREDRTVGTETVKYGVPNWKSYDGKTSLTFDEIVFKDGRKDGKEGIEAGEDPNEEVLGLNPNLLENYVVTPADGWDKTKWPDAKNQGVTEVAQNLFWDGQGTAPDATAPIFVIPTGEDIEIVYDVETRDDALESFLSDGMKHGISTQNTIKKTSDKIFTATTKMEAGKAYQINILLGMTSVKFEATVIAWDPEAAVNVELPANQQP